MAQAAGQQQQQRTARAESRGRCPSAVAIDAAPLPGEERALRRLSAGVVEDSLHDDKAKKSDKEREKDKDKDRERADKDKKATPFWGSWGRKRSKVLWDCGCAAAELMRQSPPSPICQASFPLPQPAAASAPAAAHAKPPLLPAPVSASVWNGVPGRAYDLAERVGEGVLGAVFKARALVGESSEEWAAVKSVCIAESGLAAVEREVRVLTRVRGPNIAAYLGACAHDKRVWIANEWAAFGSLRDCMRVCGRPLSEREIAAAVDGALRGLAVLHAQGIAHLDLRASNILLTRDLEVKLADWGLQEALQRSLPASRPSRRCASPWTPPEAAAQKARNSPRQATVAAVKKADIWALGVTAVELAEGRSPTQSMLERYAPQQSPAAPAPAPAAATPAAPAATALAAAAAAAPERGGTPAMSRSFREFVGRCLMADPDYRPNAPDLIGLPFIVAVFGQVPSIMRPLAEQVAKARKTGSGPSQVASSYPALALAASNASAAEGDPSTTDSLADLLDMQSQRDRKTPGSDSLDSESECSLMSPPSQQLHISLRSRLQVELLDTGDGGGGAAGEAEGEAEAAAAGERAEQQRQEAQEEQQTPELQRLESTPQAHGKAAKAAARRRGAASARTSAEIRRSKSLGNTAYADEASDAADSAGERKKHGPRSHSESVGSVSDASASALQHQRHQKQQQHAQEDGQQEQRRGERQPQPLAFKRNSTPSAAVLLPPALQLTPRSPELGAQRGGARAAQVAHARAAAAAASREEVATLQSDMAALRRSIEALRSEVSAQVRREMFAFKTTIADAVDERVASAVHTHPGLLAALAERHTQAKEPREPRDHRSAPPASHLSSATRSAKMREELLEVVRQELQSARRVIAEEAPAARDVLRSELAAEVAYMARAQTSSTLAAGIVLPYSHSSPPKSPSPPGAAPQQHQHHQHQHQQQAQQQAEQQQQQAQQQEQAALHRMREELEARAEEMIREQVRGILRDELRGLFERMSV
eukprot:m51a1_g5251 putative protein serine threonine kinase (996) ;mRNA; r:61290-65059